jgi:hypothetical protein
MTVRALAIIIPAMVLALVAVGCSSDTSATTDHAPTRAAFIKRADAVCERTDGEQKKGQIAFSEEHPKNSTKPLEEEAVLTVGLPPVLEEAEELGELTPPQGDEARVEAIVKGLEEAVKKAEAKPSVLLREGSSGPFAEVFKLAREYGFKACATPL